jgi:hypothetical protein
MRRLVSTLVVVCLLAFGPAVAGQPRGDDPRPEPRSFTRIIKQVVRHLLAPLGDSLSPPHP